MSDDQMIRAACAILRTDRPLSRDFREQAATALESLSADRDWLEARVERLEGHIAHNEEASITYGRQITEENDRLRKDNVRLRASLEEIVEITDRDHVAWDRAREALDAAQKGDG